MSKFKLILFDADIIIYLAKEKKLEKLFNVCVVYLTEIIYNEIQFYMDDFGKHTIDKEKYKKEGKITVLTNDIDTMGNIYQNKNKWEKKGISVHDGEIEAISYVLNHKEYKLCVGDKGAIQFACVMGLKDNLISLETLLGGELSHQYTKKYMKKYIDKGMKLYIENFEF